VKYPIDTGGKPDLPWALREDCFRPLAFWEGASARAMYWAANPERPHETRSFAGSSTEPPTGQRKSTISHGESYGEEHA
jgi:hypothetical protein